MTGENSDVVVTCHKDVPLSDVDVLNQLRDVLGRQSLDQYPLPVRFEAAENMQ